MSDAQVTAHPSPEANQSDLNQLLEILPESIQSALKRLPSEELIEVILDLGRPPEARFPGQSLQLTGSPVEQKHLREVVHRVGDFGPDNRVGIPRTLHRISAIRNRNGQIIGLTLRVGRAVLGTIDLLRDLLDSGKNILLLGRPGVGKTTKLRETARILSDELNKRVIVVDTSNEIGGDGDIPHPAIGGARRMQVPHPDRQHATMIEAVENHMPEVIIVDEIGTSAEAAAARTIAERGVQLIGTAHGTTLENLILNPTLSDLIGGVHTVTLSDEEARRQRRPKTISERKAPPTFDVVIELVGRDEILLHPNTATAVDAVLLGRPLSGERRILSADGRVDVPAATPAPSGLRTTAPAVFSLSLGSRDTARIFPYELNASLLERVARNLDVKARIVRQPRNANLILAPRAHAEDPELARICEESQAPLQLLKKDNATSMRRALQDVFALVGGMEQEEAREAVQEVEHAVQRVLNEQIEIELAPRSAPVRKMQHRILSRYHLISESKGREPYRHLVLYPPEPSPNASNEAVG